MMPRGMRTESQIGFSSRRRIYLLRHADVCYFDEQGKPFPPDTVPLTEIGIRQAEAAGNALVDVSIDRIIATGMPRTQQTAEIMARNHDVPIETQNDFREIAPGRLKEIPVDELQRVFLGAFDSRVTRESRFLGGETYGAMQDRVLGRLRQLVEDTTWRQLILVAHGGVNRVILAHALGADLACIGRLEQDPACLNIIDIDEEGRPLVRMVNYVPYDPAKKNITMTTMEKLFLDYVGPKMQDDG